MIASVYDVYTLSCVCANNCVDRFEEANRVMLIAILELKTIQYKAQHYETCIMILQWLYLAYTVAQHMECIRIHTFDFTGSKYAICMHIIARVACLQSDSSDLRMAQLWFYHWMTVASRNTYETRMK